MILHSISHASMWTTQLLSQQWQHNQHQINLQNHRKQKTIIQALQQPHPTVSAYPSTSDKPQQDDALYCELPLTLPPWRLLGSRGSCLYVDPASKVRRWRAVRTLTTAASILKSYQTAVNDPDNELVHLYEIRDALSKRFGRKNVTCKALKINSTQSSQTGIVRL